MMLMTFDWQPWFSYGWWHDIAVPALGALGSIAVGGGAIAVAFRSNRIAQTVADREVAAEAAAKGESDRVARGAFALVASEWVAREVYERESGPGNLLLLQGRGARNYKEELDVRAATLGQLSTNLLDAISKSLKTVRPPETEQARMLIALTRRFSLQSIQAWVENPEFWWQQEQESEEIGRAWDAEEGIESR